MKAHRSSSKKHISAKEVRGPMYNIMDYKRDDEMMGSRNEKPMSLMDRRNHVCVDIGRFFFENGILRNVVQSPSFINMVNAIANYGKGFVAPSLHEMETWILKEELKTTTNNVNEIKATWKKTGVSLLVVGWLDMRNRSFVNLLVNNQHGTVFLRAVDASDYVNDAQKLFELLDGVIEEIGEEIVIQVVTEYTSTYKAAGNLLMEKRKSLYWTPCAAQCIDSMLGEIGELSQPKIALLKAKRVSNFIHNHQWVLNLTRKFTKKELIRPSVTRFATAFLTLESMHDLMQPLQMMFVSNEWASSVWANKLEGRLVKEIVMDDETFWPSVVYSIKITKPLLHVLRVIDAEKTPGMGYIYGVMDEARKKIAKNLNEDVSSYKEIWDIIDTKWEHQLHCDLHALAYYLNPGFGWSPDVFEHLKVKLGIYRCIERLIKDDTMLLKINNQLEAYKYKQGLFGFKSALATCKSRPPVQWWDDFGDEVPELKAFAIRILGLTCSIYEHNSSTFGQVHPKKRNRISTKRMHTMWYVGYNKGLKQRFTYKKSLKEEYDPLVLGTVCSDDEWVANPNDESDDDGALIEVSAPIEVREANEDEGRNSKSMKRKSVQADLKDEDYSDEEEDDDDDDDDDDD